MKKNFLFYCIILLWIPTSPAGTLSLNKTNYGVNESISVMWTRDAGEETSTGDWVGIYTTSSVPSPAFPPLRKLYLGGQLSPPEISVPSGSLVFPGGMGAGAYAVRLFGGDSYREIAPATNFTVSYGRSFASWSRNKFGAQADIPSISGTMDDPEGDGLSNLLEYALGIELYDFKKPPIISLRSEQGDLSITYPISPDASGVTIVPEWSDDLQNWKTADIVEAATEQKEGVWMRRSQLTSPGKEQGFLRLRVEPEEVGSEPQVEFAWFEAIGDLSERIAFTWVGLRDQNLFQFRPVGGDSWQTGTATLRTLPGRPERVRTGIVTGLAPDTLYEFRSLAGLASDTRRFRTLKAGAAPKLAIAADEQSFNWSEGSRFDLSLIRLAERRPDLVVWVGDLWTDDGQEGAVFSLRAINFFRRLTHRLIGPDGSCLPQLFLAGNHDAISDNWNPDTGQLLPETGAFGRLVTMNWDRSLPNVGGRGFGWLKFGDRVGFICLDTNHFTMISHQRQWFIETLAALASEVEQIVIFSHIGPLPVRVFGWNPRTELRRDFTLLAQQHPNVISWVFAHEHMLAVSRALTIIPGEEGENFNRWTSDPTGRTGIRYLGAGGIATVAMLQFTDQFRLATSLDDGTTAWEAGLAMNASFGLDLQPSVAPNNQSDYTGSLHFWEFDFGSPPVAHAISVDDGSILKSVTFR